MSDKVHPAMLQCSLQQQADARDISDRLLQPAKPRSIEVFRQVLEERTVVFLSRTHGRRYLSGADDRYVERPRRLVAHLREDCAQLGYLVWDRRD